MNNGLIFNGEGPTMSGTWYNPSNGDSFTVADSFFQDNQYIVKTTDGRMLDYNFIQHYIKSDKPIQKQEKQQSATNLPKEVSDIIADDMLGEDKQILIGNLGNLNNQPVIQTPQNQHIIEKALSKRPIPFLNFNIEWMQFPRKELDMLTDVMEINEEEVLDWYVSKIDLNTIKNSIKDSLRKYIDDKFNNKSSEIDLSDESEELPHMCTIETLDAQVKPQKTKSKKSKK